MSHLILALHLMALLSLIWCAPCLGQSDHVQRPVTPDEEATFREKHVAVKRKLIEIGENFSTAYTTKVFLYPPKRNTAVPEIIDVSDSEAFSTYDRRNGTLTSILARSILAKRVTERKSGKRYQSALSETEARERMAKIYEAILGNKPPRARNRLTSVYYGNAQRRAEWKRGVQPDDTLDEIWPRSICGIPFRDDFEEISIGAIDGAFFTYHRRYNSDAPPSAEPKITQDQAADQALSALKDEIARRGRYDPKLVPPPESGGLLHVSREDFEAIMEERRASAREEAEIFAQNVDADSAEIIVPPVLVFVNPNTQFRDPAAPGKLPAGNRPSRLAWVTSFYIPTKFLVTPDKKPKGWCAEIWIDAADGAVIGGQADFDILSRFRESNDWMNDATRNGQMRDSHLFPPQDGLEQFGSSGGSSGDTFGSSGSSGAVRGTPYLSRPPSGLCGEEEWPHVESHGLVEPPMHICSCGGPSGKVTTRRPNSIVPVGGHEP